MRLHTTNKKKKNTDTIISPARHIPAALLLQVSVIAVYCVIDLDPRNTAI
jgi:hypothetical protein